MQFCRRNFRRYAVVIRTMGHGISIQESGAQVVRLANGLMVVAKSLANRVVTVDVWVGAGSAYEDDSMNGASHFLKHMLFKGTERFGLGELDKLIMGIGGVWNAATSMDFTHYYVTVAAPFYETALDVLAEMIQRATLEPSEVEKERQVILEEFFRKQDDPWGFLFDALYGEVFEAGPYRRTVLGTYESISNLTRDQLVDYYERMYAPENIVVLVVGDVPSEAALAAVQKSFEKFHRPLRPLRVTEPAARYRHGSRRYFEKDIHETYLALALPAPSLSEHDDVLTMDVVATLLGEGRSSRLYRRLKEDLQLVDSIWAGFPAHRWDSVFYVGASLDRARLDLTMEEVMGVIQNLAVEPPEEEELAKAKRMLRNQFCYATETSSGQSSMMGYYLTLTGSPHFYETYLAQLMKVTAEQVRACVQRYLLVDPVVVGVLPMEASSLSAALTGEVHEART